MLERNRRNNLTANFSVTKDHWMQRSVLRFAVGIYIQLKRFFFCVCVVVVRGLKKNYDLTGIGIGLKQLSGLRDWGNIFSGWRDWRTLLGTFSLQHLAGKANLWSDFTSRNAPDCSDPNCQIGNFVHEIKDSIVRSLSIQDILNNKSHLPFTTRSAWLQIKHDCPDLRRVHVRLKQGTRPSKKLTNIRDVKRYLSCTSIVSDNVLVVKHTQSFAPVAEAIVVPRPILEGLLTALHIKLNHPSHHQFQMVLHLSQLTGLSILWRSPRSCRRLLRCCITVSWS